MSAGYEEERSAGLAGEDDRGGAGNGVVGTAKGSEPWSAPSPMRKSRRPMVIGALVIAVLLVLATLMGTGLFNGLFGGDPHTSTIPLLEPTGPANGTEVNEALVTLSWSPYGSADSYCLLIASLDQYGLRLNRSSPIASYALYDELADGTYRWTVRAVVNGVYGPTSEPLTFTILTRLNAPVLSSPDDGSVHDHALPILQWNQVCRADEYRLQISDSSSFTTPVVDIVTDSRSFAPEFDPLDETTYHWRSAAHHGSLWSEWSDVRSFSYNVAVAPPTLIAPPRGATVLGDEVSLNWSAVLGASRYQLQVGTSTLFEDHTLNVTTTDSSYLITLDLAENTTYSWRVRAEREGDWSPWSGTGRFFLGVESYSVSYGWTFDDRSWTIHSSINGTDYYPLHDEVRSYRYADYVTEEDPTVTSIALELRDVALENGYDPAQFILSFVQGLPYTNDEATTGQVEYPRYPVETLVDGGGDCEDKAALYASLMRSSPVGIDAVLLKFSSFGLTGHMAAGIAGESYEGRSYLHEGGSYYYCETTTPGWEIGNFPSELEEFDVSVLAI